jgi:hypothetical protein
MEAFEAFVALSLESEGFVVSEAQKFPVSKITAKTAYTESQTHGFEVDLIGARADRLVLATVKSGFGSRGVVSDHLIGETASIPNRKRYALLNDREVRDAVVAGASERFGYQTRAIELRVYVGRFAAPKKRTHETRIRNWCAQQIVGAGPIQVRSLSDIVGGVTKAASHTQYRNNQVLVTMKVLEAAGLLNLTLPDRIGDEPG